MRAGVPCGRNRGSHSSAFAFPLLQAVFIVEVFN